MLEPNELHGRISRLKTSVFYALQASVVVISFLVGGVTGTVASYINIRSDIETIRGRVTHVEDQLLDIHTEIATWRAEDREFASEMRKSMAAITTLLMGSQRR